MVYIIIGLIILLFIFWAEKGKLLQKSTIAVLKESGVKNIVNLNFFHVYFYMRWPDKYLKVVRWLMPQVKEKDRINSGNSYHAKVLTPDQAKKIISINKSIPLQDLEQIIPYPVARKIVLTNPVDIVVLECPCRASAKQPCTPSMVCMVIGKPFTDLVLEHHPHKSKRLTETDALQLLEEVHRQGCIHSAFFKDACLDRFYVICNCCKCCCCGVEAMVKFGMPIMAPSGFSARIDANLCVKCGACQRQCPFGAISVFGEVIHEKCMGCGVCISSCKKSAVILQRDETKGIPLDVSVL